jgi:hypothetical protein
MSSNCHTTSWWGAPLAVGALVVCGTASWDTNSAHAADTQRLPAAPANLELGAGLGVGQRFTSGNQGVEYGPSLVWDVHATVLLLPWLGLKTAGGMEYLEARVAPGALGVAGSAATDPAVFGPRVALTLEPRLPLGCQLELLGSVGVGWQRLTAEAFRIVEPTPLLVSERTGVLVEVPLQIGARVLVWPGRLGVSLSGQFTPVLSQSGALFEGSAGAAQTLRQDTGQLERVTAFPEITSSFSTGISVDILL